MSYSIPISSSMHPCNCGKITGYCTCNSAVPVLLSEYSDTEIAREYHRRMLEKLSAPKVGSSTSAWTQWPYYGRGDGYWGRE
jgi:hypothetical protein